MTELVNTENKHGICPFQSGMPIPASSGGLAVSSKQIQIVFSQVFCCGADCQLWDASTAKCALKSNGAAVADLLEDSLTPALNLLVGAVDNVNTSLAVLEPPKGGPSPIMRIAAALEKLVAQSEKGGAPETK